jgi:hypothetical protein
MADEGDVRNDAVRLLWAMHKHKVGDQVNPSGAAYEAGLVPGTPRWKAAVDYLVRERAIEPDEEASGLTFTGSEEPFYMITPRGMALLNGYMPK